MKIALAIIVALFAQFAHAADARFCGVVYRDAVTNDIIRSTAQVSAFKREWPCPNKALNSKAANCSTGWQVDHIIPLDCGGCDTEANMQWLPATIKTCKSPASSTDPFCKDRWERKVYCNRPIITVIK